MNQLETTVTELEDIMDNCGCSFGDQVERICTDVPGEASVWVCSDEKHRRAAMAWVTLLTGKVPTSVKKA
jgi:hypothetical protein